MISHFTSSQYLDLGIRDYNSTLDIQKHLHQLRSDDIIPDTFIFVEHNPEIYTIGRTADPGNYPDLNPILVERGGDVTYHGPGQLIMYPIVRVYTEGETRKVREFVNEIERIVMDAMESLGFHAHLGDEPGVWVTNSPVGDKKVASLGMKLKSGVSFHGIAINYDQRAMEGFLKIRPCGLPPEVMGYLGIDRDKLLRCLKEEIKKRYENLTEMKLQN